MRPEQPMPWANESPAPRRAAPLKRSKGPLSPLLILGILFILLGLGSLLYVGWQYYGTNVTSNQAMAAEVRELSGSWKEPVPQTARQASNTNKAPAGPAGTFALLRIPKFGPDYIKPIVAGTEAEELAKGVGWYTATAQPGQVGNFAIAGHRITHGEPFARLLELNVGDKVEVELRDVVHVYELTHAPRDLTVTDAEGGWVLEPKPAADKAKRGGQPDEAIITLTTCTDLFASPDRSVGFGKLVETRRK